MYVFVLIVVDIVASAARRVLPASVLLWFHFLSGVAVCGHSLEDIRAILSDELNSLHSVQIKYQLSIKSHPPYRLGDGTSERAWIRQGDQRLMSMTPLKAADGRWSGMLQTFDGATTHSVVFDTQDPTRYSKVAQVRSFTRSDWTIIAPDNFTGEKMVATDESLATLLSREDAHIVGSETVGGEEAVHIDLGLIIESNGVEWDCHAWLSPNRHYLPVKLHFQADPKKPANKSLAVADPHFTFTNLAWEQVFDKTLNRAHDYPVRSEMDCALSRHTFIPTEVVINEAIPLSVFQPEPHFGTEVIGRSAPGDPNQTVSIAGGEAAIAQRQQKLVEKALQAVSKTDTSDAKVDARPREGQWMTWLWKLALVITLLLAACYGWQLRESAS